ncbi:MAG: hypothetical protein ABII19_03170 [Patescibacteria group bacterium]
MGREAVISEAEALAIRRQWENEILPRAEGDRQTFDLLRGVFQRVSEKRLDDVSVKAVADKKRDPADDERVWWERWFNDLGFARIAVPKPAASNRDFARWRKSQVGLIYVPAATRAFYERFMVVVGQVNWTVAHEDRESIVWDDSPSGGYWLKVDLASNCPGLGMSWDALQVQARLLAPLQVRLLSLAEYVIAWYATKARFNRALDLQTSCWTRTRCKVSNDRSTVLHLHWHGGEMKVMGIAPEELEHPLDRTGGRAAEVVLNAV